MNKKEVNALPNPLRNDVFVENPLWGRKEVMEEEMKAIPEASKAEYIRINYNPLFKRVKVVKTGSNVQCIKAGGEIFTTPASLMNGTYIDDEKKYVMISERDILATW